MEIFRCPARAVADSGFYCAPTRLCISSRITKILMFSSSSAVRSCVALHLRNPMIGVLKVMLLRIVRKMGVSTSSHSTTVPFGWVHGLFPSREAQACNRCLRLHELFRSERKAQQRLAARTSSHRQASKPKVSSPHAGYTAEVTVTLWKKSRMPRHLTGAAHGRTTEISTAAIYYAAWPQPRERVCDNLGGTPFWT